MSEGFAVQMENWTTACLRAEAERGLSGRTMQELRRYFGELLEYVRQHGVGSIGHITPAFLNDFLLTRADGTSAALVKAYVWSLRKLGSFLALRQIVDENPARHLRHPRISKRAHLPEYLTAGQLRQLLEGCAQTQDLMDLCVVSLLATTGLRPHEITTLKRDDVLLGRQLLLVRVKGGWMKRTPISNHMTELLRAWYAQRTDDCDMAFVSRRGRCLPVDGVRRIVREAGQQAGLPFALTPRQLRHTFATFAVDRHGITMTRALLGHSSAQHTAIYTHLAPGKFRRLMHSHPYQTTPCRGRNT